MKKRWMILGSLVGLLLIGAVGAVAVYAQSPAPPTPSTGTNGSGTTTLPGLPPDGFGHGHGPGDRQLSQTELDAAAKALNMTSADLSTQLSSGKTLQDIATAQGVDFKTVMQTLDAVRPVHLDTAELDAAAKALNMTSSDLSTQLQNGKTLSDLAASKGVTLQSVQDAITAARHAEMTTQIQQAVTSGQMTQDKADWLLQGLSKGYLDGPNGFGFGHGFGLGGPNHGQPPAGAQQQLPQPSAPTATP